MNLNERPYQVFFPLSLAGAFALSVPWIGVLPLIQKLAPGTFPPFPKAMHVDAALQWFLLPAVTGFLLTALPRIHGKNLPGKALVPILFLVELSGFPLLLAGVVVPLALTMAVLFALSLFLYVRGTARPVFSIPIVIGLAAGLAGALWRSIAPEGPGTAIIAYGMMPLLIGGAGGMLVIPMSDFPAKPEWKMKLESSPRWLVWILALAFACSSVTGVSVLLSYVQAFIATVCGAAFLHLHQPQWFKTMQARVFYGGAVSIVLGLWCMALFPVYRVHMAHLLLAGGLSMAIAAVMVQVSLSHGGHVMRPLSGTKLLLACGILLLLAAVTRISAALIPSMYLSHLSYAAMAFAAAWIVWIVAFARKIRHQNPS